MNRPVLALGLLLVTVSVAPIGGAPRALAQGPDLATAELRNISRQSLVWIELTAETATGQPVSAYATGVILNADGLVVTSYHLVSELEALAEQNGDPVKPMSRKLFGRVGSKSAPEREMHWVTRQPMRDLLLLDLPSDIADYPYLCLSTKRLERQETIMLSGFSRVLEHRFITGAVETSHRNDTWVVNTPVDEGGSGSPLLRADGKVAGIAMGKVDDADGAYLAIDAGYVRTLYSFPEDCASPPVTLPPERLRHYRVEGVRRGHVVQRAERRSPELRCYSPHCEQDTIVFDAEIPADETLLLDSIRFDTSYDNNGSASFRNITPNGYSVVLTCASYGCGPFWRGTRGQIKGTVSYAVETRVPQETTVVVDEGLLGPESPVTVSIPPDLEDLRVTILSDDEQPLEVLTPGQEGVVARVHRVADRSALTLSLVSEAP